MHQVKNYKTDYRVNVINNSKIISIEITCCGKHIGEIRFKDGETKKCPLCNTIHLLRIQHNHFHIRPLKTSANEVQTPYGLRKESIL
ncbi:MAG TPA: hypothetical protein PL078_02555 [Bacillota bacterium]|nr:hypothetical protein [Bacillota bacterium]